MDQIVITFDPETQTVKSIEAPAFKSTAMVAAVLTLALEETKFKMNMQRVQQQQQLAAQQLVAQQRAQQRAMQIKHGIDMG